MNDIHLSSIFRFGVLALCVILFSIQTNAAQQGKADLILQHLNPKADGTAPQAGDVLNIALKIDSQQENVTGVVVYLSLDDEYFEIIPARQSNFILFPFRQGDWLQGTVALNSTLGDSLNDSMANLRPDFQLVYNEDRKPSGFGGSSTGVSGSGILAELSVRLIKDHNAPLEAITVDHLSATGSESGYFIQNSPGTLYSLSVATATSRLGDFNNDNVCDFQDFLLFVQNYGQTFDQASFSTRYDLDSNQEIGFSDFLLFVQSFNK